MSLLLTLARGGLRARWRAWLMLTVLVGLGSGAVIAAAAGARRTDGAYARFLVAERVPDLLVISDRSSPAFATFTFAEVAKLPRVLVAGQVTEFTVVHPTDADLLAPADDKVGRSIQRRKLLDGRLPRRDRTDELAVSFTFAEAHDVGVGDRVHLDLSRPGNPPAAVGVDFEIVGIEAAPTEFPPASGTAIHTVWASRAFARMHGSALRVQDGTLLRLRHGARDIPAVGRELQRLSGGALVLAFPIADQSANVERSIHPQAVALWLLAALLALAGVLIVGQLLVRQALVDSSDNPTLFALGLSRRQLWIVAMGRVLAVALVGAALGIILAWLGSPLTPVGLAGKAEPDPGFAFDATAVGLGAVATVVLVLVAGGWPAWRASRVVGGTAVGGAAVRPSATAGALARLGAPASLVTGVRLAFERGRGRTAVPVRSTVGAATIAIAALALALTFNAGLGHLLDTPRLYGANWDASVSAETGANSVLSELPALRRDTRIADLALGASGAPVELDGRQVAGIAFESVRGASLLPPALEGRRPRAPDEVMLGSTTMDQLHTRVGGTVEAVLARVTPLPRRLKVVGRGVFPTFADTLTLGKGWAMTYDGIKSLLPPGADLPDADTILVRFRPGTDVPRGIAALKRTFASDPGVVVAAPDKPTDLVSFGRVDSLPIVLASVLAALALATLAHLLMTSIRTRRRDLAILKMIGFAPGQVRATVAWQATALATVAVVIGLPIGVIAGRWIWTAFAHGLGTIAEPTVPIVVLAALVPVVVVVANLVALVPGWLAGRMQPARALRSE